MPKNSHTSHGNNDFSVELDISDYTEEITEAIKQAIRRGLTKIGLAAEGNAKKNLSKQWKPGHSHVVTGRLRNSITHEVDEGEMAVYIGTNVVEYAPYEEEGTSKRPAHPFLRPAAQEHIDEYAKILKDELQNGG